MHNVRNALAAIAVGREVGVSDKAIAKALAEFRGVGRRFQRHDVAIDGGAFTLIDDYGHHPAEMAATLEAARASFPGRRLVLAFQPHRYTRTRDLFEDFVRVLSTVDVLVLSDVYPAGEAPIVAADGRALARAVRVAGKVEPVFVEDIGALPQALRTLVRDGDVVVTMGAGSIGGTAAQLVPMMMHEPIRFVGLRGRLARDVPLAKYTSWRAGGPADVLYMPADRDDLATFLRQLPAQEPVTVLGLGSNTLVRDGGVRGTVVVMHNPGAALAVADGLVYAEAGAASPKLARFAATHGCAEAEFLAGVPGTVGGALAMNAGCYGGETWRYVARVEVLSRSGQFEVRTPGQYDIAYRHVAPWMECAPPGRPKARIASLGSEPAKRRRGVHISRRHGSGSRKAMEPRHARASRSCSHGASPRSRCRCPMPAACSAIRRAITPRGWSSSAASRDSPSAMRACRRSTRTSSSIPAARRARRTSRR